MTTDKKLYEGLNNEAQEEETVSFREAITSDQFINALNSFCDSIGSESSNSFKNKVQKIVEAAKEGE